MQMALDPFTSILLASSKTRHVLCIILNNHPLNQPCLLCCKGRTDLIRSFSLPFALYLLLHTFYDHNPLSIDP